MKIRFMQFRRDCPSSKLSTWIDLAGMCDLWRVATTHRQVRRHRKHGMPRGLRACTICIVESEEGVRGTGFAFCSGSDNFVTKIGRRIALGRALKEYRATTNERKGILHGV